MKSSDIKAIIKFAVENEVEAYEFYKSATVKVKDQHLKETFQGLAEEELEHKRFLEDFLVSNTDGIKLDGLNDYKIAETIDKPKLTVDMSFADAIALAIKNEEEAMVMYKNLADVCIDEEQKKIFLGLMKMEQMHKAKLEDIYVNVAYAEVW